jgi:hypothetical protein
MVRHHLSGGNTPHPSEHGIASMDGLLMLLIGPIEIGKNDIADGGGRQQSSVPGLGSA